MRVLVLAEYYPRAADPVLGVWAHRQTLAARDAGAEPRVLVLHRPVPPLSAIRSGDVIAAMAPLRQPPLAQIDGLSVAYLRYLAPPRPWSYQSWGAWAALPLRRALRQLRRSFAFDLVHAHYAVPAGDAIRRADPGLPLVVSVHGHDVQGLGAGGPNVRRTLAQAGLVLANSRGTAERSEAMGARATRVVHLGTDLPVEPRRPPPPPTLVTVAHLAARKRHADVLEAVARLAGRYPSLRYLIVGDGPERESLRARAAALGLADRVELRGQVDPDRARAVAQQASLFVMPSVHEAFGVAYIEAMAAGVPAIGCQGEDGPQEIAEAGPGIRLVPPRDPVVLAEAIDALLSRPHMLEELGREARETVRAHFTWEQCGRDTVDAYRSLLS